jgi:hypothetical protein
LGEESSRSRAGWTRQNAPSNEPVELAQRNRTNNAVVIDTLPLLKGFDSISSFAAELPVNIERRQQMTEAFVAAPGHQRLLHQRHGLTGGPKSHKPLVGSNTCQHGIAEPNGRRRKLGPLTQRLIAGRGRPLDRLRRCLPQQTLDCLVTYVSL